MGRKRSQGSITSFFGPRTGQSKEADNDADEPEKKKPRSVDLSEVVQTKNGVTDSDFKIDKSARDRTNSGNDSNSSSAVGKGSGSCTKKVNKSSRQRKKITIEENDSDDDTPASKTHNLAQVGDSEPEPGDDNEDMSTDENVDVEAAEGNEEHGELTAKESKSSKNRRGSLKKDICAPSATLFKLSSTISWKPGKPVPYKYLAEAFEKVEAINGRLAIQAILTDVFNVVIDKTPEDLVPLIYLSINKLAPSHEGLELGIGESILLKGLAVVTGRSIENLKSMYDEQGDLGDVAASTRATQKTMFPPPPLTVRKVFSEFRAIAQMAGRNTQEQKKSRIVKLLVAASRLEAKYIVRALLGKLRIHLADKTVIASLAAAMVMKDSKHSAGLLLNADGTKKKKLSQAEETIEANIKDAANILQNVHSQLPVWDKLVPEILRLGAVNDDLKGVCKLTPGVPVYPMLAKPTKSVSEVLDRFADTEFTCEFKYDGERAQVHRLEDGAVKIYSRNSENLTPKYPDFVSTLPLSLKEEFKNSSFILDGESVAYDTVNKKILPFQVLQGRKRKDVNEASITVKTCFFAFDILFFNGQSLIHESLKDRRKLMSSRFQEKQGVFMFAKGHDSRETEEIMDLLNDSIKAGCEGLMVKALVGSNSTYEPANRTQNWLKVKKDYLEGCGDTLDLVPIGGYIGRGKRTGSFGAFLLACYDSESEEYQSICKIGTGFSDADLDEFGKHYNDKEQSRILDSPKSYYRIPESKNLIPDKWFEPCQVWEVLCADLSISPQHKAALGLVDETKGIALRFPRFLRLRDDKSVEEATTSEQVAEFYRNQSAVANQD